MKKILLSLLVLASPVLVFAQAYDQGYYGMFGNGGMMSGGWGFGFMGIGFLLWLVIEVLVIVWLWEQINKKK